jgi:predicted membrane-bound dolichyl-phosphate-mannose-protein mannosyltransferase
MVPVMNFETKDAVYTQEKKQREGFVYMEIWRIIFFFLAKIGFGKKTSFWFYETRVGLKKGRR